MLTRGGILQLQIDSDSSAIMVCASLSCVNLLPMLLLLSIGPMGDYCKIESLKICRKKFRMEFLALVWENQIYSSQIELYSGRVASAYKRWNLAITD